MSRRAPEAAEGAATVRRSARHFKPGARLRAVRRPRVATARGSRRKVVAAP